MEVLLFALALALLLSAGGGVTLLLLPRGRRVSALEVASLSILFGAGVISLASFFGGFIVKGWWLRALVTLVAVMLGAAMWRRGRSHIEIVWRLMRGWPDWLAGGLLLLQLIIVIWASARLALGYDGLFIWEFKAQLIHRSGGIMPLEYFRASSWQYSHPNYPLLVPLTDSWFYGWMGEANQGFVKLVSPLFYSAIVGLLVAGGARLSGSRWRGVTAAAMFFFVPWVVLRTVAGEADLPLAAFYLGAVLYLLEYLETEDARLLVLVGVLGALMPWVKRDGVVLWGCLLGVMLIKTMPRRDWRAWVMIALPGVVWLGFWRIFLWGIGATAHPEYLPMTWGTLKGNIGRIPTIARSIWEEVINWRTWSVIWALPAAGLLNLYEPKGRRLIAAWLLLILAPMALYGSIYIFSAWDPFTYHIGASLGRLLLHLTPVVLLGATLLFRGESRRISAGNADQSPQLRSDAGQV
jgi:hypothetical protein